MRLAVFTFLLGAACGDNRLGHPPGTGGDDDMVDAPVIPSQPSRAVVVAGDFTPGDPGVLSSLDLGTMIVSQSIAPAGAVDSDPILRKIGDELFIVNRSDNNVTILAASDFSLVEQIATGAGSNPQDVAVLGNKLFVPIYGGAGVAVLTRGSTDITTIDLSVDDPDGKPNCESIFLVGTDLYVACQNLDGFTPRGAGKVYVVDATTQTLQPTKTLTLTHANPFSLIERAPAGGSMAGDLFVATVGDFSATNVGCVERITPGTTPTYQGCLPTNADVGGFVNRLDFIALGNNDTLMWMAVGETYPAAALRGYDLGEMSLWSDPLSPSTEQIIEVVSCPDTNTVVTDNKTDATGLRVYTNGVEQTTAALPFGLSFVSSHGLACY